MLASLPGLDHVGVWCTLCFLCLSILTGRYQRWMGLVVSLIRNNISLLSDIIMRPLSILDITFKNGIVEALYRHGLNRLIRRASYNRYVHPLLFAGTSLKQHCLRSHLYPDLLHPKTENIASPSPHPQTSIPHPPSPIHQLTPSHPRIPLSSPPP